MNLFYIRHAQSQNNALWDQTGSAEGRNEDPDITTLGINQAEILAEYLSKLAKSSNGYEGKANDSLQITHLYCSPMVRTIQTALPVSAALGIPIVMLEDLHEGGGIYLDDANGKPQGLPGKPRSYFQKYYPQVILPADLEEEGWWNRDFESRPDRFERGRRLLQWLLENHSNGSDQVMFIGHAAFYNYLLAAILGLKEDHTCWFRLNNIAITRIDFNTSYIDFVYQNSTSHIPDGMIT